MQSIVRVGCGKIKMPSVLLSHAGNFLNTPVYAVYYVRNYRDPPILLQSKSKKANRLSPHNARQILAFCNSCPVWINTTNWNKPCAYLWLAQTAECCKTVWLTQHVCMSQMFVSAVLLLALLITSHYQLLQTEMKRRLVGVTADNNLDNILGKLLMWSPHTAK